MNPNIRVITQEELKKINKELAPFGVFNQISSGTCISSRRVKNYHIVLNDKVSTYRSITELRKIGSKVKETFGATEVFCSGVKIA